MRESVERYRRLLGLPDTDATPEDVRCCYRREMLRWHPDRPGGDQRRAQLLNDARTYLLAHPAALRVGPESDSFPAPVVPAVSSRVSEVVEVRTVKRFSVARTIAFLAIAYVALLAIATLGWILTTIAQLVQ